MPTVGSNFFERSWQESWTYIKTVVDVVHEPVLILNKDLCVVAANEPFYKTFQVLPKETENKVVYELGNGQWNIPSLRKLLEDILPKSSFFKGFEVSHDFPVIGHKVMILNARQIHVKKEITTDIFPAIILLAIEDVTELMTVAKKLSDHSNFFETRLTEQTKEMRNQIAKLENQVRELQIQIPIPKK